MVCLNPCCNGYGFLTVKVVTIDPTKWVLILVVMDMGFWLIHESNTAIAKLVLILVVMDMGFWQLKKLGFKKPKSHVLILVVMDMGFWPTVRSLTELLPAPS